MSGSIPFILEGSFVHPGNQPATNPINNFQSNLKTNILDDNLTFQQLLELVMKVHEEKQTDIYCTSRHVLLVPKQIPQDSAEIIQLFKLVLSQIFTPKQVYQISCGNLKEAFGSMSEASKQILEGALDHFLKMNTSSRFYTSPENKEKFVNLAMKFFTSTDSIYSFVIPVQHDFNGQKGNFLLVAQNNTVVSFPSGEVSTYKDMNVSNTVITITLENGKYITIQHKASVQLLYNFIDKSVTPTKLIINSLQEFQEKLNIQSAKAIAYMVSHCDTSFIKHLYTIFPTDPNKQFLDVITLFQSQSAVLRLLKYLACTELLRTGKSNEIFRQNNHYIRGILFYFKHVSKNYFSVTIPKLLKIINSAPNWSYDKPTEKDLETVENLLVSVWDTLTESIPLLQPSIRRTLRSLRILSEHEFSTPEMNHRSCFALFMLRFLFIEMTDPNRDGMNPKVLSKVLVFTKLLAFAGQMMPITGDHNGERQKYNAVIAKTIPHGVKFYEKLTEMCELETQKVSDSELIAAAEGFRAFILEHAQELQQEAEGPHFFDAYASEGVAEYYISHKN